MCGIIGIVGVLSVQERLIESLKRLEYRGYDSAGVAGVMEGAVVRRRAAGKIRALEEALAGEPMNATVGIGHTRWATHGAPTERNAHPHTSGRVTLVHNGIIENFSELKAALEADGRRFVTDTDTEVVAQLLDRELAGGKPPTEAFKATLDQVRGAFALVIMVDGEEITSMGEDGLARIRSEKIGFIFQSFHLIPSLTAYENVLIPMEIAGTAGARSASSAWSIIDSILSSTVSDSL